MDFSSYFIVTGIVTQGGTERNVSLVGVTELEDLINQFSIHYQHELDAKDDAEWREYTDGNGATVVS